MLFYSKKWAPLWGAPSTALFFTAGMILLKSSGQSCKPHLFEPRGKLFSYRLGMGPKSDGGLSSFAINSSASFLEQKIHFLCFGHQRALSAQLLPSPMQSPPEAANAASSLHFFTRTASAPATNPLSREPTSSAFFEIFTLPLQPPDPK